MNHRSGIFLTISKLKSSSIVSERQICSSISEAREVSDVLSRQEILSRCRKLRKRIAQDIVYLEKKYQAIAKIETLVKDLQVSDANDSAQKVLEEAKSILDDIENKNLSEEITRKFSELVGGVE